MSVNLSDQSRIELTSELAKLKQRVSTGEQQGKELYTLIEENRTHVFAIENLLGIAQGPNVMGLNQGIDVDYVSERAQTSRRR